MLNESFSSDTTPRLIEPGLLRLKDVLALIPLSRSAWYAGIQKGKYPAPIKIGVRASAWLASDIRDLIDRLASREA